MLDTIRAGGDSLGLCVVGTVPLDEEFRSFGRMEAHSCHLNGYEECRRRQLLASFRNNADLKVDKQTNDEDLRKH